jgi:hypothetical protein
MFRQGATIRRWLSISISAFQHQEKSSSPRQLTADEALEISGQTEIEQSRPE